MPSSWRLQFATLLVHCSPADPKFLWKKFELELSRDDHQLQHLCPYLADEIRNKVLGDISKLVEHIGKNFVDYHLAPNTSTDAYSDQLTKEVENERNIEVLPQDLVMASKLNVQ